VNDFSGHGQETAEPVHQETVIPENYSAGSCYLQSLELQDTNELIGKEYIA
jgi:hypothetical protein